MSKVVAAISSTPKRRFSLLSAASSHCFWCIPQLLKTIVFLSFRATDVKYRFIFSEEKAI